MDASAAIGNDLGHDAHTAADHGSAAGKRFDQCDRKILVPLAREDQKPGLIDGRQSLLARHVTLQLNVNQALCGSLGR